MNKIDFCDKFCPMPARWIEFPKVDNDLTVDCDLEEADCPFKDVDFSKVNISAIDDRGQPLKTDEGLREAVAKWLFENRDKFHAPRFYAGWENETKACPYTKEEYLKASEPLSAIFSAHKQAAVEEATYSSTKHTINELDSWFANNMPMLHRQLEQSRGFQELCLRLSAQALTEGKE